MVTIMYNYGVLQVSRDVTSSVLDAIDVASVSLARHLDDGQASLTVETSSFTVTASRQQAVDVGGSFVQNARIRQSLSKTKRSYLYLLNFFFENLIVN